MSDGASLREHFYALECTALARALLGQTLVRVVDGMRLTGRIVEVESYLGGEDAASHSKNGKKTQRNEPMYMKPGTAYVYSIYGMYFCCNISSKGAGAAVLLRALEPLEGLEDMRERRLAGRRRGTKRPASASQNLLASQPSPESQSSPASQPFPACQPSPASQPHSSSRSPSASSPSSSKLKTHQLCNGPSKLCSALSIDKESCNKVDMSQSQLLFLEGGAAVPPERVVACKRIGIDACGPEWANKPLRFYELGSKSVSVRDKRAEEALLSRQGAG